MRIPFGHEGPQAICQLSQVGEVGDAQSFALQDAEPLLMTAILRHVLSVKTNKSTALRTVTSTAVVRTLLERVRGAKRVQRQLELPAHEMRNEVAR